LNEHFFENELDELTALNKRATMRDLIFSRRTKKFKFYCHRVLPGQAKSKSAIANALFSFVAYSSILFHYFVVK